MNTNLFDQNYDLGVMSEADMLALSETLNMIEPGLQPPEAETASRPATH